LTAAATITSYQESHPAGKETMDAHRIIVAIDLSLVLVAGGNRSGSFNRGRACPLC
jgi:hypothetical protein